jgi:hypothetical protein
MLIGCDSVELPSLDDVRGGFNLQSTDDVSCTEFDSLKSSGGIKGDDYTCAGGKSTAESKTSGLGTTGSGSSSNSTDTKSGAVSFGVNLGLAGLAGAVALVAL